MDVILKSAVHYLHALFKSVLRNNKLHHCVNKFAMTKNVMVKKSLKHVEIALNNFNEIAVPYHENLLEELKSTLTQVNCYLLNK